MEKDNQQHVLQNADTFSLGSGLSIYSKADTKKVIEVTNNRAHYFANLAKKFRDEAKIHCENAKHYAEENSNVTYDQLIDLRNVLETKINTKQDSGNYALQQDIPVNVSDLENDSDYITTNEAETLVNTAVPSQTGNAGKYLHTDGNNTSWVKIPVETMFSIKTFDHILSFEESKGYALQGTWVYKTAAPERYGYPDFYEKCLSEKTEVGTGTELTINDLTATIYNHSDGHQFYDIEDKTVFDSWSEANTGIWAYGIDEENERIFLPKRNIYYTNEDAESNASKIDNNRYQYIVVGNTEDKQTLINTVPVTTAANDTIPLFTGMYFDFKPNSPSWLKAGMQQNSGGIYTSCYNTLVNCLTAANNIYDLKVIEVSDMIDGTDYSEYWKVNQDEMTFVTPTTVSYKALNGSVNGDGNALMVTDGTYISPLAVNAFKSGSFGPANVVPSENKLENVSIGTSYPSVSGGSMAHNHYGGLATASQLTGLSSGIIAEESTAQLYFKVANAVQNLELLDAGEVLEALANKVDKGSDLFNGQWVFEQIILTNSTAANQSLDLSNYLPDDGYNYEVMLSCQSYSSGDEYYRWIYTDIMPCNVGPWRDLWCNTNTRHATNAFTVPVGTGRVIYLGGSGMTSLSVYAKGYRRIGAIG